jgi:hypothetical protein
VVDDADAEDDDIVERSLLYFAVSKSASGV